MKRVRVRRERPTAVALAVALCVTMLVVYVLTLGAKGPDVVESMAPAPRVTREIAFEALEGWCVRMVTCESQQDARLRAAAWVGLGAAGYVAELDGAWTVLGAVYDTEREARRVADRLSDEAGIPADVICLKAEEVRLRVTAPQAQIDAVAGADELLRSQAARLGELALQLDRSEIAPDAVRTLCALAVSEANEAATFLSAIPGAAENGLCAELIERLANLSGLQATLADAGQVAAPALAGMLRCAQLEVFVGQWELDTSLSH